MIWAVMGGIGGAIVGSFLALLVIRLPEGKQVVSGRSRCDQCHHVLAPRDLVPVLSFTFNRGRCRQCGAAIDPVHLLIELAAGAIGALSFAILSPLQAVLGAMLGWILLTLAALDMRHLWLPDRMVLALAVIGLASAAVIPSPDMTERIVGGIAGFGSLYCVATGYLLVRGQEGMGGGDPKLFGAIGCWTGWQLLPLILLLAALIGLASALIMQIRGRSITMETALPLGSFLALATFPVWLLQSVYSEMDILGLFVFR